MKKQVKEVYEKFDLRRKETDLVKADKDDLLELEKLEQYIKISK
jgi:hypothetical protein